MGESPRHVQPLPHTIAQVIDGEAIVINLVSGAYYSLDGPAAMAWEYLARGATLDATAEAIARRYDVEAGVARTDLERLTSRLLEEDLCEDADGRALADVPLPATNGPPLPYTTIQIHAYRDMAELLALDPPMPGLEDIVRESDPAP